MKRAIAFLQDNETLFTDSKELYKVLLDSLNKDDEAFVKDVIGSALDSGDLGPTLMTVLDALYGALPSRTMVASRVIKLR